LRGRIVHSGTGPDQLASVPVLVGASSCRSQLLSTHDRFILFGSPVRRRPKTDRAVGVAGQAGSAAPSIRSAGFSVANAIACSFGHRRGPVGHPSRLNDSTAMPTLQHPAVNFVEQSSGDHCPMAISALMPARIGRRPTAFQPSREPLNHPSPSCPRNSLPAARRNSGPPSGATLLSGPFWSAVRPIK
jgi:hypothetical protein